MKRKHNKWLCLVTLMLLLCCSMLFVACHQEGGTGGKTSGGNPMYAVAFKIDGRNYDVVLVEEGKTVTLPTSPEKNGYTFDGWYADEACTQEYTASAVSQNTDVYAKFTANVYTITYEVDGGINSNTANTFTVEDKITLADAQKSGFAFDGWYLNGECVSSIPKGTTGNVTLTARFTAVPPNTYTITYDNLQGADNSQNPKQFTAESGEIRISDPADRLDYEFVGWSFQNGTPAKDYVIHAADCSEHITLSAVWALKEQYVGLDYFISGDNTRVIINGVTDANLTKITLPDETSFIFKGAFESCTKLESISLPFVGKDNNKALGDTIAQNMQNQNEDYCLSYLFGGSDKVPSSLKQVTVRGGNIASFAFYGLNQIETLVLEGDIEFVGKYAFDNCTSLKTLTMQNSTISTIYTYAFRNCNKVLKITLPATLSTIQSSAFYNNYSVIEIYNLSQLNIVPGEERKNGSIAYYAQQIHTSMDIPSGFSEDDEGIYYTLAEGGKMLVCYKGQETTYTVPSDIKLINSKVFQDRTDMVSITLPENLTYIGAYAFQNCVATINIPPTVTYIGEYAFQNCTAQLTVPTGVITVGSYAFENTSCGEEVTFSANGTEIDSRAFRNCKNLKKVTFSGENINIGSESFQGCSNLEFVTFTGKGVSASVRTFSDTKIEHVDIASENASFYHSFQNLQSIQTLTISANGVSLESAFYGSSLVKATIKGSAVKVKECTFEDNTNLTTVLFLAADTTIGKEAFYGCSKLESVILPSNITEIGECSFQGCQSLRTVIFGDRLKSIPKQAFMGCSSLTNIKFGSSVESIGESAFRDCGKLSVVNIPASLNKIGQYAFRGDGHLCEINLHDGMTIEAMAFYNCGFQNFFVPKDWSNWKDYACSHVHGSGSDYANIYFCGTQEELAAFEASLGYFKYTYYLYSESEPARNANNTAYLGNYWHYNAWGEPELWNYKTISYSLAINKAATHTISGNIGNLTDGTKGASSVFAIAQLNAVEINVIPSTPVGLSQFTITIGAGADRPGRIPKKWSLSAYNIDTGEWETIFSTNNGGFSEQNYESKTFTVSEEHANKKFSEFKFYFTVNGNRTDGEEALTLEWSEIELTFQPTDWTKSEGYDFRYSAIDGSGEFYHVADGNTSSNWVLPADTEQSEVSGDVVIRANQAFILGSYYLTTNGNSESYENTGYGISKWAIYGTNDPYYYQNSDAWVLIDQVSGDAMTLYHQDGNRFFFRIEDNTTAYKFYKFVFTKTDGESNSAIGEIELVKRPAYSVVSGTATKSSENYDKVCDQNTATKWCVNFNQTNGVYVIFKADAKATLYGYTFTTANDNASEAAKGRNPKSWTIYGSNSSNCVNEGYSGWTEIVTVTDNETMQDLNYTPYSFTVDGASPYRYYKIVFTENGGNSMLQLSEIELNLR